MNNMNNFYKLFEVFPSASTKEIIMAYENKITKYNNIKKLSKEQIYDIKMLKIGLHILINPQLRKKYNQSINTNDNMNKHKNNQDKEINKSNNEPMALNSNNEHTLDSLFNVDNSWMKDVNISTETTQSNKKTNFETNIGDRVFSLSNYNKRPGFSSDFEAELRKPLQGREDKSSQMLNKNKM
jgi:DnaJ-class molecular chaperone